MIKLVSPTGTHYWVAPHTVAAIFGALEAEQASVILNHGGGTLHVTGKPAEVADMVRKAVLQFSVDVARATADALVKDAT